MNRTVNVAVVGAGPYGLSVVAHLRGRGLNARIFGSPMETWRERMPKGMFLKSEGFASSLYDPDASFTLAHFCRDRNIPYADLGVPVALDTFTSYGIAFQRRFAPDLDPRMVADIAPSGNGFELRLSDGETIAAQRVVVAIGLSHYHHMPSLFSSLPREFATHSSEHHDLSSFAGRNVTVIGAGASAVDTAILLHAAGATTSLVARAPQLKFHDPPPAKGRSLLRRMRWPLSGLGNGWKSRFYSDMPDAFYCLPDRMRVDLVRTQLGPAPGWFTRAPFENVRDHTGVEIRSASVRNDRVHLRLMHEDGRERDHVTDHVIAGTGYRVDLDRLGFLGAGLRPRIEALEGAPILTRNFESTVPNLFFAGVTAAHSFGPLLRFAYGARFTARRLTRRLAA